MFSFMIVVNDNGELKSVSREEIRGRVSALTADNDGIDTALEEALNKVLDERSAAAQALASAAEDAAGWHSDEGSD